MKKYTFFPMFRIFSFFVCLAIITASCSNPTSSDDDHDEHQDPFGVALIMNGVEIATQENGVVTYITGDHIEIHEGEETDLITVRWISEDGDRFEADAEEGYSLRWSGNAEEILEVETHEEDGPWQFHLHGVSTGDTEIQFELWHNDDHKDFTSAIFTVHVEEGEHDEDHDDDHDH